MTSMFETNVRNRREHTRWARVNHLAFMKEMATNGEGEHYSHTAKLSVQYRPDVASRFWWTIKWTSDDGQRYEASAQELDLCLWRAAEIEISIQKTQERLRQGKEQETQSSGGAGERTE